MSSAQPGVELRLPPDIFGGNPGAFLKYLGLSGQQTSPDRWQVQSADPTGDLITTYDLADELSDSATSST
ncbi:MAG: hypothetical protein JWR34_5503 [Mycobacterium sp.]|nr:hypothetical protein [Mycobacterium sp.]